MTNLGLYKSYPHVNDGTICWCLPVIYYEPVIESIVMLHRPEDRRWIEP